MTEPPDSQPNLFSEQLDSLGFADPSFGMHSKAPEPPPIVSREIVALALIVAVCDLAIYRGHGFTGLAMLFLVLPATLMLGMVRPQVEAGSWCLAAFLVLTSLRLVWCGSSLAVAAGFVLLCGFSMSLSGLRPYVMQAPVFAAHLISAGHRGLHFYAKTLARFSPKILQTNWFAVILPLVTLFIFSTIFVLANPDLVKSFSSGLTQFVEALERWLDNFQLTEVLFCMAVGWIAVGALRPDVKQVAMADEDMVTLPAETASSPLYDAFRNTLVMVIGLFAVYLMFEFLTLWFRKFPKGFYYSGYAHEGAAWLTVALGLATLLLSVIFRGSILADPRLPRLRLLSWVWSIENLLLVLAVFNRLFIYVGFNGMTRMRVIGFLGVASVVGGFVLVVWKITYTRSFVWLIRRQLWVVSFAAWLYTVLPVDGFVNRYNVRRILAGDPAPSVQISVHPTSAEGFLCLEPLTNCEDMLIREGIRALLVQKFEASEALAAQQQQLGWTAYQLAEIRLLDQLRAASAQWTKYHDVVDRSAALDAFHRYAYQWY